MRAIERQVDAEESSGRAEAPEGAGLLAQVSAILMLRRDELADRGVERLWIFGSVATGEARQDSDVDVLVDLSPDACMSLTGFARLRLDLEQWLGRHVDLARWSMIPERMAQRVRLDAVRIL